MLSDLDASADEAAEDVMILPLSTDASPSIQRRSVIPCIPPEKKVQRGLSEATVFLVGVAAVAGALALILLSHWLIH